jgi:uncharacterized membrane protein
MNTPFWALTLVYWLHMLATVTWIGSLAAISLVVLPAVQHTLDARASADLLEGIQKRLDPLAWFSLVLLAGTGMVQMSANPNYGGFLAISNRWAAAILVKHVMFFGMAGISAYLTWGVLPRLRRSALRRARGLEAPEAASLQRQEAWLLRLNLILGVVVLALTALARSS